MSCFAAIATRDPQSANSIIFPVPKAVAIPVTWMCISPGWEENALIAMECRPGRLPAVISTMLPLGLPCWDLIARPTAPNAMVVVILKATAQRHPNAVIVILMITGWLCLITNRPESRWIVRNATRSVR